MGTLAPPRGGRQWAGPSKTASIVATPPTIKNRVPSCIVRDLLWSAVGTSTSRIGHPDQPMNPILTATRAEPTHQSVDSPTGRTDGRQPDESRSPSVTEVETTATENQMVPVHMMR